MLHSALAAPDGRSPAAGESKKPEGPHEAKEQCIRTPAELQTALMTVPRSREPLGSPSDQSDVRTQPEPGAVLFTFPDAQQPRGNQGVNDVVRSRLQSQQAPSIMKGFGETALMDQRRPGACASSGVSKRPEPAAAVFKVPNPLFHDHVANLMQPPQAPTNTLGHDCGRPRRTGLQHKDQARATLCARLLSDLVTAPPAL